MRVMSNTRQRYDKPGQTYVKQYGRPALAAADLRIVQRKANQGPHPDYQGVFLGIE